MGSAKLDNSKRLILLTVITLSDFDHLLFFTGWWQARRVFVSLRGPGITKKLDRFEVFHICKTA